MHPTQFVLRQQDNALDVTWSDGHKHTFALRYLRGWCPCATCQGHFTGAYRFIERDRIELVDIEPVGSYAFRPVWSDGHKTGLYAFAYLLQIEGGPPGVGPTNEELLSPPESAAKAASPTDTPDP